MKPWTYATRAKWEVLASLAHAGYCVGSIPDALTLGILTEQEWCAALALFRRLEGVKGRAA